MTWAQYQEDDIVDQLLDYRSYGVYVDIGAGDGEHISNTRLFRERGWQGFLVEGDETHLPALRRLSGEPKIRNIYMTPTIIDKFVPPETNLLSIDVDGDDIFLLEALEHRPECIIIEHNPTMPRTMDVAPSRFGLRIGASIPALCRVAEAKDYGLVAVTVCNAIFLHGAESIPIPSIEPDYVVCTEYFSGRPLVLGTAPWGVDFTDPYPTDHVHIRPSRAPEMPQEAC